MWLRSGHLCTSQNLVVFNGSVTARGWMDSINLSRKSRLVIIKLLFDRILFGRIYVLFYGMNSHSWGLLWETSSHSGCRLMNHLNVTGGCKTGAGCWLAL